MATVELRKITKAFDGNVTTVQEADFTINDKEFVVLVGPSGCGKSTTLRMVAVGRLVGVTAPRRGRRKRERDAANAKGITDQ